MKALSDIAADLAAGRTTSRALVERCLAAIADPEGEGKRAFTLVDADGARAAADAMDALRRHGHAPSRFAGVPIAVKDLFDVQGQRTQAGSAVLHDAQPAARDATAIGRLRAAGFVIVGRNTMTEFAYSGLGINAHVGTPLNPWDRATGRIPGGSSSGAAVAVTDGMAAAGIGSDTGGSCRIPAALTGIVGWKPTQARVPLDGAVPLAPSLDSIGPLAPTAHCCAVLDAVMAAEPEPEFRPRPVTGLRLIVPQAYVLDGMDAHVGRCFERALQALSAAGARIDEVGLAELKEIPAANAKGGFAASEAFAWHAKLLEERGALYDPRVRSRILRGSEQSARDYIVLRQLRRDISRRILAAIADAAAVIMPTVPIVAPPLAELDQDADAYHRTNLLLLRNPSVANFLDGCSISIPMHAAGEAPAGLMLMARGGADHRLLRLASGIEAVL